MANTTIGGWTVPQIIDLFNNDVPPTSVFTETIVVRLVQGLMRYQINAHNIGQIDDTTTICILHRILSAAGLYGAAYAHSAEGFTAIATMTHRMLELLVHRLTETGVITTAVVPNTWTVRSWDEGAIRLWIREQQLIAPRLPGDPPHPPDPAAHCCSVASSPSCTTSPASSSGWSTTTSVPACRKRGMVPPHRLPDPEIRVPSFPPLTVKPTQQARIRQILAALGPIPPTRNQQVPWLQADTRRVAMLCELNTLGWRAQGPLAAAQARPGGEPNDGLEQAGIEALRQRRRAERYYDFAYRADGLVDTQERMRRHRAEEYLMDDL